MVVSQGSGSGADFYVNRNQNDGAVILNRMGNVKSPTGLFCCLVPDAANVGHKLCINVGKPYYSH